MDAIKVRLQSMGKTVIESDVIGMADRIRAYDTGLRLVYDSKTNEYQVYSTDRFPHVEMVTHQPELSKKLLSKVQESDNMTAYGFSDKMADLEYQERTKELIRERKRTAKNNRLVRELRNADVQATHYIQGGV